MRWLSSAICTRVLPVSCGFAPNLATISAFCSWVSVVMSGAHGSRGAPPGRGAPRGLLQGDRARLVDVVAHLLDQRLDRVEALLAAQALHELDPQPRAVQVAVVVEQERLDQLAATGDEHRPHADVRRG